MAQQEGAIARRESLLQARSQPSWIPGEACPRDGLRPDPGAGKSGIKLAAPDATQLMVLFAALCAFAAAAFAPQLLWDGDTLWHLKTGDWMWAHHQVPNVDPFSFTVPGRPWTNLEWLSELIMAPIYAAGGWSGLHLWFAFAIGALALILGAETARKLPVFSWAAALFLALACTTQSWLARPHLMALPLLALWTVQLIRAREARRAPPLWLLPVMVLWANLHGSFLLGLALIAPFALEAVVEDGADRLKSVRGWVLFGLAAGAAALITPHGLGGILHPIRIGSMRTLQDIAEWKSSDFSHPTALELSLLTALFALLYRGVSVPLVRLIVLLGLLHLTLKETRHQMVLAVVAVLLLAEPIGRALAGDKPAFVLPKLSPGARMAALAVMILAFAGVSAARLAIPAHLTEGPTAPIKAFAHVPQDLRAQPVLNDYGMGGYLIFNGVKPFIDGRADMYGDDFFEAYVKALKPDQPRLQALLARYKVRWTLLRAENPAVPAMDAMPGWKRLYADKTAVVHVKVGP